MGASSVTGVGMGMSEGKWKAANSHGCCGKAGEPDPATPPIKRGCSIKSRGCCGTPSLRSCCNARIRGCG